MIDFELELQDPVAEVGGAFRGRVVSEAEIDAGVRAVRVWLRFEAKGRGNTDGAIVDADEIPLHPGQPFDVPFTLRVPPTVPISYDGRLIRVVWELGVRVDRRLAKDQSVERTVLVVPEGGQSVYRQPHPLPAPT